MQPVVMPQERPPPEHEFYGEAWEIYDQAKAPPAVRQPHWPTSSANDRTVSLDGDMGELFALCDLMTDLSSRRLILEAGRTERNYWRDLWAYRELFIVLAMRDVAVRYKQTFVGVAWAIIRPLLTMIVFTLIFGKLAKLPSDGNIAYPVLVFAGLLPWFLFSGILGEASSSLVANANLISKVYFPRLIIPSAAAVVGVIDFAINLLILIGLMAWYNVAPSWRLIFLPAYLVFAILASLGPALLVTALNVKYRDFRYVIPFILQFGLYVSPVGFSSAVIPENWRLLYSLNPIVGVIDGFRWSLLGASVEIYWPGIFVSALTTVILFWGGVTYFRKTERTFADLV